MHHFEVWFDQDSFQFIQLRGKVHLSVLSLSSNPNPQIFSFYYNKINFKQLQSPNILFLITMTATVPASGYLIDQEYEVSTNFLISKSNYANQTNIDDLNNLINEKSQLKAKAKNTGSYQVILEQSLTTQDKPFLYEILIETDLQVIRNSLQNLAPKKVVELLNMIKSLLQQHIKLGKGLDHCSSIALWLQELIKIHLATIVSNIQNKNTIISIRKWINKKVEQKQNLQKIKQHLLSEQNARQIQQYKHQLDNKKKTPKFQYIEQQKQHIEEDMPQNQAEDSEIKDEDMEGLELDDLQMDDFEDEF